MTTLTSIATPAATATTFSKSMMLRGIIPKITSDYPGKEAFRDRTNDSSFTYVEERQTLLAFQLPLQFLGTFRQIIRERLPRVDCNNGFPVTTTLHSPMVSE